MAAPIIEEGDHVVFRREGFARIHQIRKNRQVYFEKTKFNIEELIGQPYGLTFEIDRGKLIKFEPDRIVQLKESISSVPGADNRNLLDADSNQKMSKEDIMKMKDDGITGEKIIEELIENSETFKNKTEFSQAKYLKKKKKKHILMFTVLRPTPRLVMEIFTKEPAKICNLRPDTLSQLLSYSNIMFGSNAAVVETCQGLVLACVLQRMGGQGKLIHLVPNEHNAACRQVMDYFSFPKEHLDNMHIFPLDKLSTLSDTTLEDTCTSTNLSSGESSKVALPASADTPVCVDSATAETKVDPEVVECMDTDTPTVCVDSAAAETKVDPEVVECMDKENGSKNRTGMVDEDQTHNAEVVECLDKENGSKNRTEMVDEDQTHNAEVVECLDKENGSKNRTEMVDEDQTHNAKVDDAGSKKELAVAVDNSTGDVIAGRKRLLVQNREVQRQLKSQKQQEAGDIIKNKRLDSLILACKYNPTPILMKMLEFMSPSRPVVVFCQFLEPLVECYTQIKKKGEGLQLRLSETWFREYQVLPQRTHPMMNMSGTGGYLLTFMTVRPEKADS